MADDCEYEQNNIINCVISGVGCVFRIDRIRILSI